jgi:hypothetical protein
MLVRRDKTEARLMGLYEHPDGTPREGNEDEVEAVYERLNKRYNNINRAMLTVFAQFLVADLPTSSSVGTTFAIGTPDILGSEPPCPYSHIRDHPSPPPTCPVFDPIVIDEISHQALLTHRIRPSFPANSSNTVWAVADSGATHILIKNTDAHISRMSCTPRNPVALWLCWTQPMDQGTLNIGTLSLTAYIFQSRDLVNNLLGLAPFADHNCTSIFKTSSFSVYRDPFTSPVLHGIRDSTRSLWLVGIGAKSPNTLPSDGIPPPYPVTARVTLTPQRSLHRGQSCRSAR